MGLQHSFLKTMNNPALGGAVRLVNRIARPPVPIPVQTDGVTLYAATMDRLFALWMRRLTMSERFEAELWRRTVKPGMVVADVGGNLGFYSILASRGVGPEGTVHCFEPHPGNLRMLRKGLEANRCGNVVVHAAAVSDEVGQLDLFARAEHQGDHRIYKPANGGPRSAIKVEVTTLDEVFQDSSRLDVVKLDIQGAEPSALRGMRNVIEANPGLIIFMEFWPTGLRQSGSDPVELLGTLRKQGFTIGNIDDEAGEVNELSDEALMSLCEKIRYTNLLLKRE